MATTSTGQRGSDDGRRLTEMSQRTHPGWTRLQWKAADGHDLKTQYRGPGGEVVSRDAFMKRVRSGEVPTIDPDTGAPKAPPAAAPSTSSPLDPPALVEGPASAGAADAPVMDLPDAKASSARPGPGQASPAELALTFQIGLVVLSSLAALFAQTPELSMSEIEAQAIGVPLANIAAKSKLNQRFGRYLADSSDYTLLGYALYSYSFRVGTTLAARRAAQAAQPAQGGGGFAHAVPTTQAPQPAGAAGHGAVGAVRAVPVTEPAAAAASGGIAAAARGSDSAEAARIVGYRPIQNPRAG